MARGGYGSGTGIPLQDRVRGATSTATGPGTERDDCPARHCWVAVPVDGSRPRPGLLLQWRKVERGRFEGLVTYAAQLRPGRWTTVTEWVPAELLTQADRP